MIHHSSTVFLNIYPVNVDLMVLNTAVPVTCNSLLFVSTTLAHNMGYTRKPRLFTSNKIFLIQKKAKLYRTISLLHLNTPTDKL